MSFRILLVKEFFRNLRNDYTDNYTEDCGSSVISDEYSPYKVAPGRSLRDYIKFLRKIYNFILRNYRFYVGEYYRGFKYLYEILNDSESKDLLVKILTYKVLGYRKVKLPLNTAWYWEKMSEIEKYFSREDMIKVDSMNWELRKIDLRKIGYPIDMYYVSICILTEFVIKQYEYKNIKVSAGDTVIDAGGCYGDTALLFANETGNGGKVFSFEFIPTNVKILRKNIELNEHLKDRIEVIENPLWSESGKIMYYRDMGPGSMVSFKKEGEYKGKVNTVSIDDFVRQKEIKKIDFIKMDIEGAEPEALKGAIETIKKFKPKMAVCIYHKLDHFISIPRFLNELNVGYKFYLKHSSIYAGETVLFASVT